MSHKSIQIFPPLALRHWSTDDIIASHPKKSVFAKFKHNGSLPKGNTSSKTATGSLPFLKRGRSPPFPGAHWLNWAFFRGGKRKNEGGRGCRRLLRQCKRPLCSLSVVKEPDKRPGPTFGRTCRAQSSGTIARAQLIRSQGKLNEESVWNWNP